MCGRVPLLLLSSLGALERPAHEPFQTCMHHPMPVLLRPGTAAAGCSVSVGGAAGCWEAARHHQRLVEVTAQGMEVEIMEAELVVLLLVVGAPKEMEHCRRYRPLYYLLQLCAYLLAVVGVEGSAHDHQMLQIWCMLGLAPAEPAAADADADADDACSPRMMVEG